MHYDEPYTNQARLTLSSVVLLVIFVGAFALILAAAIWRPWVDDDDGASAANAPADVPADQAAAEGAAPEGEALDPNAVVPVTQ